ncbi:MAG: hypothetical protein J0L78_08350 [Planctomycetes bacterium]|nr:hypothetical protein [Planctomycetota bacterium]
MKKTIGLATMCVLSVVSIVLAQIPNMNLANSIVEARQKNNTQLTTFTWTVQTQIFKDGNVKDTRIQQVAYGPGGVPQYTLLNDIGSRMPIGFFRRAIAENEKQELETYLKGVEKLVGQYTLPTSGAIVNFLQTASIVQTTGPDGLPVLQATGNSVVTPGDNMTISFNATTFLPTSMDISTNFNGQPLTMNATFRVVPGSGLNHMQYATVNIPGKGLMVNIHNYDYVPNN